MSVKGRSNGGQSGGSGRPGRSVSKEPAGLRRFFDCVKFEYYLFLVNWMKRFGRVFSVPSGYAGVFRKQLSPGNLRALISGVSGRALPEITKHHGSAAAVTACIALAFAVFVFGSAYMKNGVAFDRFASRQETLLRTASVRAAASDEAAISWSGYEGSADSAVDTNSAAAVNDAGALSLHTPETGDAMYYADHTADAANSSGPAPTALTYGGSSMFPDGMFLLGGGETSSPENSRDEDAGEAEPAGSPPDSTMLTAVKEQKRAAKVAVSNAPISAALRAESHIDWDGSLIWPAGGSVSSWYGYRSASVGSTNHKGIDLTGGTGSAIYAAGDGEVIYSGYDGRFGRVVRIRHDSGAVTLYAHCSALYVSVGDQVSQGQVIAGMGMSGTASGVHLHFEVIIDGVNVNPILYLP